MRIDPVGQTGPVGRAVLSQFDFSRYGATLLRTIPCLAERDMNCAFWGRRHTGEARAALFLSFLKTFFKEGVVNQPVPSTFAFQNWPSLSTLAGAGAGGVRSGITGALVGISIPEYEAKRYEGRIKVGMLLLDHSDNSGWTPRAERDPGTNRSARCSFYRRRGRRLSEDR